MAGGFATFGAGAGPAGGPTTPPGVTPTTLVGAWQIDELNQRYVLDANGNPLAMDGTRQRVYELVCAADTSVPVLTPTSLRQQEAALRSALRPLLTEGAITALTVTATDDGAGESLKTITWTNAGTSLPVTMKIR